MRVGGKMSRCEGATTENRPIATSVCWVSCRSNLLAYWHVAISSPSFTEIASRISCYVRTPVIISISRRNFGWLERKGRSQRIAIFQFFFRADFGNELRNEIKGMYYEIIQNRFRSELFNYFLDFYYIL